MSGDGDPDGGWFVEKRRPLKLLATQTLNSHTHTLTHSHTHTRLPSPWSSSFAFLIGGERGREGRSQVQSCA